MTPHRIERRLQQRRQGSQLRQGLAPFGQLGQLGHQSVHGGGAAGAAGVELTDAGGRLEMRLAQ
jgi:hypothetical protein